MIRVVYMGLFLAWAVIMARMYSPASAAEPLAALGLSLFSMKILSRNKSRDLT